MDDGDCGNHRVASANGSTNAVEITGYLPCEISGGLVEEEDFFRGDHIAEGLDSA